MCGRVEVHIHSGEWSALRPGPLSSTKRFNGTQAGQNTVPGSPSQPDCIRDMRGTRSFACFCLRSELLAPVLTKRRHQSLRAGTSARLVPANASVFGQARYSGPHFSGSLWHGLEVHSIRAQDTYCLHHPIQVTRSLEQTVLPDVESMRQVYTLYKD